MGAVLPNTRGMNQKGPEETMREQGLFYQISTGIY